MPTDPTATDPGAWLQAHHTFRCRAMAVRLTPESCFRNLTAKAQKALPGQAARVFAPPPCAKCWQGARLAIRTGRWGFAVCPTCRGQGIEVRHGCPTCGGRGWLPEERRGATSASVRVAGSATVP